MLIDTCVISEVRKPRGDNRVRERFAALDPDEIYLSVITIGELRKGLELAPTSEFRHVLSDALARLEMLHRGRVLPIDLEVAHLWGQITARARRNGFEVAATDGLIAATAIRYDLSVMTRNVKDFEPTGVLIVNPWD